MVDHISIQISPKLGDGAVLFVPFLSFHPPHTVNDKVNLKKRLSRPFFVIILKMESVFLHLAPTPSSNKWRHFFSHFYIIFHYSVFIFFFLPVKQPVILNIPTI